ncbi:MAG: transcription termination factor Rho [Chloroflexota bacterium]|nr:transcription termination factor Rho [Chloroflexota bacterium]MYE06083.1 transcription termination factor Rho [Chloroflexota bacterium]
MTSLNIPELETQTREELLAKARELEVSGLSGLKKQDIILRLLQAQSESEGHILSGGVLEIVDDSYGFLRGESLLPAPTDVYVSQSLVRRSGLRTGDYVIGSVRPPKQGEKYYGLSRVDLVNGVSASDAAARPHFENLTAVFPHERFELETEDPAELSGRVIDLVAPMGRGQRGLIVSPPKAGKTMLLQSIANGIAVNHPEVHLMVVLIGERPEEVTEMKRSVRGEVIASTFDEPVEEHTRVAELGLERAKRLMEMGRDVVILLDSITRLTRAYNLEMPSTGRTLSGGIDPVALYPPKRFFGSARKAEEGGSLTIISTCLVDTGSRLDDVVFEEFKGTGNWEVRLDRKLAERRIYPSIDIAASSTRREELLLSGEELQRVWLLRRMMSVLAGSGGSATEPTERLLDRLAKTKSNTEFLENLTAAEA